MVVEEEENGEEIHQMRNRKRKSSIKDRLDWSDKVVVMEEEQEAETFIENKETLASLEQNFEKKLVRPRMGMVADMVENEKRQVPASYFLFHLTPSEIHDALRPNTGHYFFGILIDWLFHLSLPVFGLLNLVGTKISYQPLRGSWVLQ